MLSAPAIPGLSANPCPSLTSLVFGSPDQPVGTNPFPLLIQNKTKRAKALTEKMRDKPACSLRSPTRRPCHLVESLDLRSRMCASGGAGFYQMLSGG